MDDKKHNIGYTQGTYDLFHIGHLNLLEHAKEKCNYLIVGINSDKLVKEYKNKSVTITAQDRARIVQALKVVDKVVITDTLDKEVALKKLHYDVLFIGDDWKGTDRWNETEESLKKYGVEVEYLPHTDGISTTQITNKIEQNRTKKEYIEDMER